MPYHKRVIGRKINDNNPVRDANQSPWSPQDIPTDRIILAGRVLENLVWNSFSRPLLPFDTHGKIAIGLLKAASTAKDDVEAKALFYLYVVGTGLPKCFHRLKKNNFLQFFKTDFNQVVQSSKRYFITTSIWRTEFTNRWKVFMDHKLPEAPAESDESGKIVMSREHSKAIHCLIQKMLGKLEQTIKLTKASHDPNSLCSTVKTLLALTNSSCSPDEKY